MAKPRRIVDEFRILKLLNAAPQTTVFHAEEPESGRPVVIKLLNVLGGEAGEANRRRFEEWSRRVRELAPPCLPELLDSGFTPDGRAFLVTSFVEGVPIATYEAPSLEALLSVLAAMVRCLETLASGDVPHLNLVQSNVLVDGEGVRLVGLGSAAFLGAGSAGGLMGHSPEWDASAAPELIDAALAAGQPPWKADLYAAALVASTVLGATVESPGGSAPSVTLPEVLRPELADPVGLEEVLATCLRRAPSERSITLAELAETLQTGGESAPMPGLADLGAPGPPSKLIAPPAPMVPPPLEDDFDPNRTRPSFTAEEMASFIVSGEEERVAGATGASGEEVRAGREEAPPLPPPPPAEEPPPPPRPPASEDELGTVMAAAADGGAGELQEAPSEPAAPPPPPQEDQTPGGTPEKGREGRAKAAASAGDWKAGLSRLGGQLLTRVREVAGTMDRRVLAGIVGAAVAVVVVLFLLLGRGKGRTGSGSPAKASEAPAAVVVVQPEPGGTEVPQAAGGDPRLDEARAVLDAGDVKTARKILNGLTKEDVASLSEEDRAAYDGMEEALRGSSRDLAVADLRRGLRLGDIRRLRQAVRILDTLPASELRSVGGLRSQVRKAKKALELHRLLWRAKKNGDDLGVLAHARDLLGVLPAYRRARTLRKEAAVSVEALADRMAAQRQFSEAAQLLQKERRLWPQRAGLDARIRRCQELEAQDRRFEKVLERAQDALASGDPARGLKILGSVEPAGPYVKRFASLRHNLDEALAARDAQPPRIHLKPDFKLRFKKNQTLHIPFFVTDDLGVKRVVANLRHRGQLSYHTVPLRHATGDVWVLDLTPELHGNTTVEVFLVASDASGHKGVLGTSQRPLRVLRKRWYQR